MSFKVIVKVNIRRRLITPGDEGEPETGKENTTGIYEGSVSVRGGCVNVTYSKQDNAICTISFPKADPEIVTVSQKSPTSDEQKIDLVLEKNARHICINGNRNNRLEITTDCRRLDNNIQKNGKMRIDYSVELHGFTVEKTSVFMELRKVE